MFPADSCASSLMIMISYSHYILYLRKVQQPSLKNSAASRKALYQTSSCTGHCYCHRHRPHPNPRHRRPQGTRQRLVRLRVLQTARREQNAQQIVDKYRSVSRYGTSAATYLRSSRRPQAPRAPPPRTPPRAAILIKRPAGMAGRRSTSWPS